MAPATVLHRTAAQVSGKARVMGKDELDNISASVAATAGSEERSDLHSGLLRRHIYIHMLIS